MWFMNTKNKILATLAIILIGVGVWLGLNKKQIQAEPIKIGVVMPFSGDLAMFGDNTLKGIKVALKQSGIPESEIQLITEDGAGASNNVFLSAFKKLAEQEKVKIIFGPFGPSQALIVAPTIKPASDMTVIAMTNCDERLAAYHQMFCIYPGIEDQVLNQIEFMKSRGWKKIYFMTDTSEFGVLVENILKEHSHEIELIGVEKAIPNQTKDFRTMITKMVTAKPDAVFGMFAPAEGFILLRQYPILSKNIPLLLSSDINKTQLAEIFKNDAKGIYFGARLSEKYNEDFAKEYKTMFNEEPDYFSALGHSSASILLNALKQGKTDSNLADKLTKKSVANSAINGFQFTEKHTAWFPLGTYEFKNGDFVEIK